MKQRRFSGVFAAALTPLRGDFSPDLEALPVYLDFLAKRGCHGALLLGTTGEGPSFAKEERIAIWRAALAIRAEHPDFCLLAGSGTPSLRETIDLTRAAFDLGMDAVVVLPPYYFRNATTEGLLLWFSEVLRKAVPEGGALFGYHFPAVSGVPLAPELLARLYEAFPRHFKGLKDSSADPDFAAELGARFDQKLTVFTGSDRLFSLALDHGASGCITAGANLLSPELRRVWDAYQGGESDGAAQEKVNALRGVMDRYPPAPALLKFLLARQFGFPRWPVRPPLLPLPADAEASVLAEMDLASTAG